MARYAYEAKWDVTRPEEGGTITIHGEKGTEKILGQLGRADFETFLAMLRVGEVSEIDAFGDLKGRGLFVRGSL